MTATLDQQLAYIRLLQQIANNKESAWFKLMQVQTVPIIEGDPSEQVLLASIEKTLLAVQCRDEKIIAMADSILHPSPQRTIEMAKADPLI